MRSRRWLWSFAVLPLVGVPLIAQESKPPVAADTAVAPADKAPAPAAEDAPEPASQQPPEPPDEHLSADNSLSYPVDI